MNDYTKFGLMVLLYVILIAFSICSLSTPSGASDYISNHIRVPATYNTPPKVGAWFRTPTVIVCEHAPISKTQINSATAFWERLG